MKKSWRKCAPKVIPRYPFSFWKITQNCHCMQEKKDILKEDYQKALKKLTLSFS